MNATNRFWKQVIHIKVSYKVHKVNKVKQGNGSLDCYLPVQNTPLDHSNGTRSFI